jgi:V/A-type H+-transporting ATPase subunit E
MILDAKNQAQIILEKANSEADEILTKAKKEADDLERKVLTDLRLGGAQAVTSVKQTIESLISDSLSKDISSSVFDSNDFIEKLVLEVVDKWKDEKDVSDLNLVMSPEMKQSFDNGLKLKMKSLLDKGVDIKFDNIDGKGFEIIPNNGSYKIDFTDELFAKYFADYLRGFTKELLFENK